MKPASGARPYLSYRQFVYFIIKELRCMAWKVHLESIRIQNIEMHILELSRMVHLEQAYPLQGNRGWKLDDCVFSLTDGVAYSDLGLSFLNPAV